MLVTTRLQQRRVVGNGCQQMAIQVPLLGQAPRTIIMCVILSSTTMGRYPQGDNSKVAGFHKFSLNCVSRIE
jgi:hypothetical protein